MIPRIIHSCWYGTKPLPSKSVRFMQTWKELLPDYDFKHLTNTDLPDVPYVKTAVENGLFCNVSNYTRLVFLYAFGGVYLDIDVEVLKPFDSLLADDFFVGWEEPKGVNVAVLGCVPRHPFVRMVIDAYLRKFDGREWCVHSGPDFMTAMLKQVLGSRLADMKEVEEQGLHVYPRDVFYPYSWGEKFSPECVTKRTVTIHHWANSWVRDW